MIVEIKTAYCILTKLMLHCYRQLGLGSVKIRLLHGALLPSFLTASMLVEVDLLDVASLILETEGLFEFASQLWTDCQQLGLGW